MHILSYEVAHSSSSWHPGRRSYEITTGQRRIELYWPIRDAPKLERLDYTWKTGMWLP